MTPLDSWLADRERLAEKAKSNSPDREWTADDIWSFPEACEWLADARDSLPRAIEIIRCLKEALTEIMSEEMKNRMAVSAALVIADRGLERADEIAEKGSA